MKKRRWLLAVLVVGLVVTSGVTCNTEKRPSDTPARQPTLTSSPQPVSTTLPATSVGPSTTTATTSPAPTATAEPIGWALTDVQFAIDIDQTGELVFPDTEFPLGVTRVYVRFAYEDLGEMGQVESRWYLNDNPVSSSALAWDGGAEGDYVMWIETPEGLGNGQWKWELTADTDVLGGGGFTIGRGPSYVNETWGIGFDPPLAWEQATEQNSFVTFSSADEANGVALMATPGAADLSDTAATHLALFHTDHPDAAIVSTAETTMNGRPALLQEVRYAEAVSGDLESDTPETIEHILFIVSAINAGTGYSLWVLGPAEGETELKELMTAARLSVQFLAGE